jgi:hypothetical protein
MSEDNVIQFVPRSTRQHELLRRCYRHHDVVEIKNVKKVDDTAPSEYVAPEKDPA